MPKISSYIDQQTSAVAAPAARSQRQAAPSTSAAPSRTAAAPVASLPAAAALQPPWQQQQPRQHQSQQLPEKEQTSAAAGLSGISLQYEAEGAKLLAEYEKRVREHGTRIFRWPDGSLRPERPPPNPYTVANRRQWADLVHHCRTAGGGDRSYERQGHSLRYGINVEHAQHEAFLRLVGLEPETTSSEEFKGDTTGLQDPLQDPQHCFNNYYKEGAEAVFKNAKGRLL